MNKAERAVKALREAAEAYRDLPDALKTSPPLLGEYKVNPRNLDDEADAIAYRVRVLKEAMEE